MLQYLYIDICSDIFEVTCLVVEIPIRMQEFEEINLFLSCFHPNMKAKGHISG